MKEERSKLVKFLLKSEGAIKDFMKNPDQVLKKLGIEIPMSDKVINELIAQTVSEFNYLKTTGSKELAKGYHMDDMSSVDFHRKDYY